VRTLIRAALRAARYHKPPDHMLAKIVSIALANFEFAIDDVRRLLKLHDAETKRHSGRPSRQIEFFKRAAIILSITAWESFIEDALRSCGRQRIASAASPLEVEGTFNSIAQSWLQQSPKPPDLADWVGERWKEILTDRLEADLKALNTPNAGNVKALSKRYLDGDITMSWSWKGTNAATAASRLDKLIRLRGELAHRGPDLFKGASVRRQHVEDALRLLTRLVECTERALGTAPRKV